MVYVQATENSIRGFMVPCNEQGEKGRCPVLKKKDYFAFIDLMKESIVKRMQGKVSRNRQLRKRIEELQLSVSAYMSQEKS